MFATEYLRYLYNGGLDPTQADPGELRVRRTLSISVFTLTPVAVLLMVTNVIYDARDDNPAIAAGITAILASLFIQAHTNNSKLATITALLAYWLIPTILIGNHGVVSTPVLWMLPIAPIAMLLSGTGAGIFFCILTFISFMATFWAERNGLIVPTSAMLSIMEERHGGDASWVYIAEVSMILVILTVSTWVFARNQRRAEQAMTRALEKLQQEVEVRRNAEQKAKASEQAKSVFLAAMGHELRTPLNGVIGATRLLKDTNDPDERKEFTEVIRQSGETLLELINNVLDLSSLESGKLKLEQRSFNLREVVEQVNATFAFQALGKRVNLSLNYEDSAPQVISGDSTRLRQILINLIGNALKFTEQGSVTVSVSAADERLQIQVRDTGIGISADAQNSLFEPYVQADLDTTRRFGGSGLGLAIVKRIVDAMGGELALESEVGEGSCFSLNIPLLEATEQSSDTSPGVPDIPTISALVVDDNAVNRMVLSRLLEKDGHQVVAVTQGQEAVDYLTQHPVDVVLMDIQMPVLDGFGATRAIRQLDSEIANTPIIAITANQSLEDQQAAADAGMDGFISKPFSHERLNSTLGAILGFKTRSRTSSAKLASAASNYSA